MDQRFSDNCLVAADCSSVPILELQAVSHAERLTLVRRFIKQLQAALLPGESQEAQILSLSAAAALAYRGIVPATVDRSPLEDLIASLASCFRPDLKIIADDTEFARVLCRPFLGCVSQITADPKKLQTILSANRIQSLFSDPLFPGWVYQCLRRKPRSQVTGVLDDADPQSVRAEDIQLSYLPALTQWFTPDWIGRFLVDSTVGETSPNPAPTFFDPACGAGHILVEALKVLFKQHTTCGTPDMVSLSTVLERQLFGCDIDASMAELSGLSLYLTSRDLCRSGELPLPQVFHFGLGQTACDSQAAIGSLWMGLDQVPDFILINQFGKVFRLAESPLPRTFAAVATNPPYLGHRLMPSDLSAFIRQHYPAARFDLYAAFILLACGLLKPNGRLGILCQQSFLSITRYEKLRRMLLEQLHIDSLVQLGPGSFGNATGEKVNNAIIIGTRKPASGVLPPTMSCRRVLDAESKAKAEQLGLANLPEIHVKSGALDTISGAPLSFWCPDEIAGLFSLHPQMEGPHSGITCTNGLFTCNNRRFVRLHNEVPDSQRALWAPYDKGGGQKWFRNTPYLVYWKDNGADIRSYRLSRGQSASLPGENFYFKPGITYSYIGTRGFRARLLSPHSIFDIASSAIFSDRIDLLYVLGFLNSSLVRFLLGVLNPTVNFQIGDLRKLPFAEPNGYVQPVAQAAATAVELATQLDSFDRESPGYGGPALIRYGTSSTEQSYKQHLEFLQQASATEQAVQNEIDRLIFESYKISRPAQEIILSDPWVCRSGNKAFQPRSRADYLAELSQ